MNVDIEIRPFATLEIIEAYEWYESNKEGLGLDFLNELELFYKTLQRNPYTYSYIDKPVRQGKLSRFPYNVVYEPFENKIVVYSVFMAKQHPGKKRTF